MTGMSKMYQEVEGVHSEIACVFVGKLYTNRPSTTNVLMTKYSTRMMTVMADITKPVGRFKEGTIDQCVTQSPCSDFIHLFLFEV